MAFKYSTYAADEYGFGVQGIQAAIGAAYAAGGGHVEIPSGDTFVDSEILLYEKVWLVGNGVLERAPSYSGALISISGADSCGIDGVTIDGGLSPSTRNTDDWAVTTVVAPVEGGQGATYENWWVDDDGTTDSAIVISGSDNVTIRNCKIVDHAGCGVFVDGTTAASDYLSVSGCEIAGCRRDGIYFTRGSYLSIKDCSIFDCAGSGIMLRPEAVGHEILSPTIDGNAIVFHRGITYKYELPSTWPMFAQKSGGLVNYSVGLPLVVTSFFSNSGFADGPDGVSGVEAQGIVDAVTITGNVIEFDAASDDVGGDTETTYNTAVCLNAAKGALDSPCKITFSGNTVKTNLYCGAMDLMPAGLVDVHGNVRLNSVGNTIIGHSSTNRDTGHSAIEIEGEYWDQANCDKMRGITIKDNVYGGFRYGLLVRSVDGLIVDMNCHISNEDPDGSALCFATSAGNFGVANAHVRGVYVGGKHGFRGGNMENVLFDGCTFIVDDDGVAGAGSVDSVLDPYGSTSDAVGTNSGAYWKNVRFENCAVNSTIGDATGTGRAVSSGSIITSASPHVVSDITIKASDTVILTAKDASGAAAIGSAGGVYVSAVADGSFTVTGCGADDEFYYMAIPANAATVEKISPVVVWHAATSNSYKATLPSGNSDWFDADKVPGTDTAFWTVTDYDTGDDAWAGATEVLPYPFTHVLHSEAYYICIKDNGPETDNAAVEPGTDTDYWVEVNKEATTEYSASRNYWAQPLQVLPNSGGVRMTISDAGNQVGNPHTFIDCSEVGTTYVPITYTELEA